MIDSRFVAFENGRPVGLALCNLRPLRDCGTCVAHDFDHVIAGPKSQVFERKLERKGACPAKARTNNFQ